MTMVAFLDFDLIDEKIIFFKNVSMLKIFYCFPIIVFVLYISVYVSLIIQVGHAYFEQG